MTMTPAEALAEAVKRIGSYNDVARVLGITPQGVGKAIVEGRPATAEWVLRLEKASGVAKEQLRPDIYPPVNGG